MNDDTEMQLELVELGDAKEETKGVSEMNQTESGFEKPYRPQ